jgi:DNA-binding winged helix-turn-helix (wHTH) protein
MRRFADQTPMMEAPEPPRASRPVNLARESHFQLGALLIRPSLREVQAGARRQIIEPRVMQVLVALARMDGEVVSRDELIETCWGGRIVGEDAINRCIGRLRRLAETFGDSFEIDTVARVGYRLMALAVKTPQVFSRPPAKAWSLRGVMTIAAAALAIGGGAVLGLGRVLRPRWTQTANGPARVGRAHP